MVLSISVLLIVIARACDWTIYHSDWSRTSLLPPPLSTNLLASFPLTVVPTFPRYVCHLKTNLNNSLLTNYSKILNECNLAKVSWKRSNRFHKCVAEKYRLTFNCSYVNLTNYHFRNDSFPLQTTKLAKLPFKFSLVVKIVFFVTVWTKVLLFLLNTCRSKIKHALQTNF